MNGVTVNTSDHRIDYKDPVLSTLKDLRPGEANWMRMANGTLTAVGDSEPFGLHNNHFAAVGEDDATYIDGTTLYVLSSTTVTLNLINEKGIQDIVVTGTGEITGTSGVSAGISIAGNLTVQTGGTFYAKAIENDGEITGTAVFSSSVTNRGSITGGVFNGAVANNGSATAGTFNNAVSGTGTFGVNCAFGENASVDEDNFSGAIYRNVSVSGRETPVTVEYDGLIVETLNTAMGYASAAWVK